MAFWVAYGIAFAEVSVRWLVPQPLMPRYITGTSWGVRGNIPDARYRHWTPEVSVRYRINGQGMRADRDFPSEPPEGTCRIALFGDSYFMGYELNLEDTVASVLDRKLAAAGYRAETLNFSVSGFGTAEMLLTYRGHARNFHPDVVVMQWHETDPDDNVRSNLFALEGDRLEQVSGKYLPSVSTQDLLMRSVIYRFTADHSHLYSVVRERAATAVKKLLLEMSTERSAAASAKEVSGGEGDGTARDYPWLLSGRLVEEFRREVAADGAGFAVAEVPGPDGRMRLQSTWDRLGPLDLDGAPVIRGATVFAPLLSPDTKLYFEHGHSHLTPVAASALAGAMAQQLEPLLQSRGCAQP